MAKVMVSIPDELLADIDRDARSRGTTRSGLLQRLAAEHLARADEARAARIDRLLATPGHHGGRATHEVRRDRSR
jgi:metal-responsive CopG/Arc/MetJ family transcriptional regulator